MIFRNGGIAECTGEKGAFGKITKFSSRKYPTDADSMISGANILLVGDGISRKQNPEKMKHLHTEDNRDGKDKKKRKLQPERTKELRGQMGGMPACLSPLVISAGNELDDCLQVFGDCEGQIPRLLGHFKFDIR